MTVTSNSIVVGVDGGDESKAAQAWGLQEARVRNMSLRLVSAYRWVPSAGAAPMYIDNAWVSIDELRKLAADNVERAREQLAEVDGSVETTGEAVDGSASDVLVRESDSAAIVVLGSRQLGATGSFLLGSVGTAVAARAGCPVVVTRGPAGYPAEGARVVVGVDGSPASQPVLEFAFEEASLHGVALTAVLCWRPSPLRPSTWLGQGAERARQQAEVWLSEALAGWREKFPDVEVASHVHDGQPVPTLVEESTAQYLLVVGKRGLGQVAGTVLGSVSQGVLHNATCPVAVVG